MDVNPVLQTIMEMAGLRLAVKRDSEVIAEVSGLKNQDPYTGPPGHNGKPAPGHF